MGQRNASVEKTLIGVFGMNEEVPAGYTLVGNHPGRLNVAGCGGLFFVVLVMSVLFCCICKLQNFHVLLL